MDDALGVRRAQRLGHFLGHADDLVVLDGAVDDAVAQGLAFEQLHHQVGVAVLLADVEDGADIGMVERGRGAGFTQKALAHAGHGELVVQQLDGDFAMQASVPRLVDVAHAAAAQPRLNLVRSEPPA